MGSDEETLPIYLMQWHELRYADHMVRECANCSFRLAKRRCMMAFVVGVVCG